MAGARTVTVLLPPYVPSLALTTITYEPELTRAAGIVTAALLPLPTVVMVQPDHVHVPAVQKVFPTMAMVNGPLSGPDVTHDTVTLSPAKKDDGDTEATLMTGVRTVRYGGDDTYVVQYALSYPPTKYEPGARFVARRTSALPLPPAPVTSV